MSARAGIVLLAAQIFATTSCTTYTTTFRSGKTANDDQEKHQRSTVADAYGGDEHFDLARQCPNGWAEVTFENQFAKAQVERWRCAK